MHNSPIIKGEWHKAWSKRHSIRLSENWLYSANAFEEIFGLKGLIDLRHVLVDLLTGPYAPPQMATPPQGSGTIGRTPNKSYPGVRLINPNLSYYEYEDSLRGLFLQINRYLMPILAKNTIRH